MADCASSSRSASSKVPDGGRRDCGSKSKEATGLDPPREPRGRPRPGMGGIEMMERTGNLLLDRLSDLERARVMERIEPVELPAHKVLAEPGRIMRAAYFPTDGVVSMVTLLTTGASVEAATVGKEGMAGVDLFLGGQGTENVRIICQVSGRGWSMDAGAFRQETEKSEEFRRVLERYARSYLVQATQSAACNSAHMVEQRLAKWFLLLSDWLDGEDFDLTHEFVANLLGVYRPSVTVAAGALQRAGLIEYKRGRVSILDR